ncbi:hypothetical protein M406DRAFT_65241 [Cryphonectria parasitica EP155]|uniref:Uncharacterized protein n=1 Tax=Cryphonectria parasitica (strain ATCC 38755 / EP155) TaxID=660469 RepID=A0A9P4Y067_CRYP1|nr:uncharacterized protein M406DRAFT_65241 [Cryphonectria parasitica EP155]KAF3763977.1 hypothetical protein M406DRAFT_65241 [Cryphonectria parasitica EP155]
MDLLLTVLTDQTDSRFQEFSQNVLILTAKFQRLLCFLNRKSRYRRQQVRWAVQNSVPFVTKLDGHSNRSTVGDDGFVIDLSKYSGIEIETQGPTAKLRGSILSKSGALSVTALRSGPFPIFSTILAAHMIDSRGNLVEMTQEKEPDILYAIRGAGQFFGLIAELTIKIWPLSELGNVEWTPVLVIAGRYIGNPNNAHVAFGALHALGPLEADGGPVPIQNISDGRQALEAKGGFKTFGTVGLRRFDIDRFLNTLDVWKRLVTECPDAINTTYIFQWDSRPPRQPEFESVNSLHDIRYWQNNIIWYTDVASHKRVAELNAECIDPIELRFRGEGKMDKSRGLKKKWDPRGAFTRQLLD